MCVESSTSYAIQTAECSSCWLDTWPPEPNRDINTYIGPLVEELTNLWEGVQFNVRSLRVNKVIRCALMCVACDLPAGGKIFFFLGHSARLGCSRCYKEFPGSVDSMDYSGFDRNTWGKRTKERHMSDALETKEKVTITAMEKAESEKGCRYSALVLLPYFDGSKMLVVDPMHNLFLGSAKHFFKSLLISRTSLNPLIWALFNTE